MPGSKYKGWRIRSAIQKRKQIKIYKSMNTEDINNRQNKLREIQNFDYQIMMLDKMQHDVTLQPYARLQLDCYGSFCGLERQQSLDVLNYVKQHIIDQRTSAVAELEAMP